MLNPPQIAEMLGVGVAKVHGWIESGELTAINVATTSGGRPRWAIEPDEFERFKRSRSSTSTPKPAKRYRQPAGVIEFYK
ncbi:helix-turn-helix domain-containing protein [Aeoliella mucimassa]